MTQACPDLAESFLDGLTDLNVSSLRRIAARMSNIIDHEAMQAVEGRLPWRRASQRRFRK